MMTTAVSNAWIQIMVAAHDLLDLSVLEELRESAGNAVFLEIGETFTEQIALIVSRLEEPACQNALDCLERNAHELAGAAGTFGATALAACARDMMVAGRAGDLEKTRALVAPLSGISSRTLLAFADYCASLP
jgi:HPt (histidine-containing phosphotransfer) domain-containing protein